MLAERLSRAFWPLWSILFAAISALAFGLHDWLPLELVWIGGALLFLAAVRALWRGLRRFRWPRRAEALDRLDRTLPGRPIAALGDDQALGSSDEGARAVWQAHLARMAARLGGVQAVAPDLNLAPRDPFALRYVALLALVIAALFGSLWRVAEAPGLVAPGQGALAAAGPTWEGWAEPPAYTGRPSLYLNAASETALSLPAGTRITLRLYGPADALTVDETVSGQAAATPPAGAEGGATLDTGAVRAVDFEVMQSGTMAIRGDGGRDWAITVLPDAAPRVTIKGEVMRAADGTMSQPFTASDDYEVTSGRAEIALDLAAVDRRYGLASEPEPREMLVYDLPMPITGSRTDFAESMVEDASQHPWANLPVTMTLEVTDGLGQTGRSETRHLSLPGRRFFDPVAAAVIELRRDLLWNRGNAPRVAQVLHAITHKPEGLLRNERAYLMLRVAMRGLDTAIAAGPLDAATRDETAAAFWDIAELIEDGGVANALERMRQAQERLSEAIRNGASPEEVQKLMDELRQATDDYIRQLAENMERKGADEPSQQAENGQQMTGDQLQQMMDEIQRLMEQGRMAEAQEMLDQLSRMMENLKVTEGNGQNGPQTPGGRAMEDLRQTLRDQQDLSDDAFRDLQQQFGDGQGRQQDQEQGARPGERPDGNRSPQQGQDGDQGQDGRPRGDRSATAPGADGRNGSGDLAGRQRALREALRRQQEGLPGDPSQERDAAGRALEEAGRAMEEAEQALRRGDNAAAIDRQADAIENLREGMRNLGEAIARNQPGQPGSQGQDVGEARRDSPRDPLGRETGQTGRVGTDQNLLQGEDIYRRARDLLDEIRRRSGDRARPEAERDYLRRLLDRF
ncbi:MAG: TIGR02302 family protein [Defluviimonas sp.]|nr:TIGR02302 family protein [Paracoccaceae bacterium]MCC0062615.1 TIGR02302 family protein [Defluviimonas sp.]